MKRIHSFPQILGHLAVSGQLVSQCTQSLRRAPMDDFYAARSGLIPPLPWSTFSPPFSA